MLVKDVMTKNPVTVDAKASVLVAKDLMMKNKVHKLPVVDKSGSLVGIITTNDLQRAAPSDATTLDMYELGYLLSKLTVEQTMIKKVQSVADTETVEEAARMMADGHFGCLPVMQDHLLVGIITESDLFRMFIEMFNTRAAGIRAVIDMSDASGTLSVFTQKVAEKKGKIISCITTPGATDETRKVTVKATDISLKDFEEIARSSGTVEDIREIK